MIKKLAILMPAYNAENVILESINSLLNQTFQDFELIIVNDGSTDNTGDIINRISSEYIRVRAFHQENKGVIGTRNRLLEIVGDDFEYLTWCDADDIYHRSKLETQIRFLDVNPDYIGCGSWYKKFGGSSSRVFNFVSPEALNWLSLFGTPVGFPTFMHRNIIGLRFNEELTSAEDYDFVSRLIDKGKITNLRSFLTMYRVHASQESSQNKERQFSNHKGIAISRINDCVGQVFNESELAWLLSPVPYDRGVHERIKAKFQERLVEDEQKWLMRVLLYRVIVFNKFNIACLFDCIIHNCVSLISLYKLFFRRKIC